MAPPVASLLWRGLRIYQVYGANTDVGKTVFTTLMCRTAGSLWPRDNTAFLKPVSTGPLDEADQCHVRRYSPDTACETLVQFELPASPHLAARESTKATPSDSTILSKIHKYAQARAFLGKGWLFVETAGGVHSPGPSGTVQADLYRPLRLPVVLVGDAKLGGISQTISAFESLKLRGYDIETVLIFRKNEIHIADNAPYLKDYFTQHHDVPVMTVAEPPPRHREVDEDEGNMDGYYRKTSADHEASMILQHLDHRHQERLERLESMSRKAYQHFWYPFTQQKHLAPDDISVIDSAHDDHFQTMLPTPPPSPQEQPPNHDPEVSLLQPSFDGSASWWTQGLGHGNPSLSLAAAYAAGRYGHVMFPSAVHEPALSLAETMLDKMENPRLTRVFFSDDGSTAVEVAVKMALRATRVRYYGAGSGRNGTKLGVLGLKGSYHGDTVGAMDCSEPSVYNEKVEWYEGKGFWFDYPTVQCVDGVWTVKMPAEAAGGSLGLDQAFSSLGEVFDLNSRAEGEVGRMYQRYILKTLERLRDQGRRFGALIIEPVVLGAGGMVLVDPLFQQTLINTARSSPHLFDPGQTSSTPARKDSLDWTGLPIIFDEVFTGLYRLGRFSSASFLGVHPDISVHAKVLTGGVLPLAVTLASENIFDSFKGEDKSDALLHGHSYTAHPVGCQVALKSLKKMRKMEGDAGRFWAEQARGWEYSHNGIHPVATESGNDQAKVWSVWSDDFVLWLSRQTSTVEGVWALGTVMAIHLKSGTGVGGYRSDAAKGIQSALFVGSVEDGRRSNIHSRVLGNVIYLMTSLSTTKHEVDRLEGLLRKAIG